MGQPPVHIQWGNTQTDHSTRVIRRCQLLTSHSSTALVKTLRRELVLQHSVSDLLAFYKQEVAIQAAANVLAQEWNRHLSTTAAHRSMLHTISFLEVAITWLRVRSEYGLVEHSLGEGFRHLTDEFGTALLGRESDNAQAFSHFTFGVTNGRLLVCNIQGCNNQFTQPVIHTDGSADLQHLVHPHHRSMDGIARFFANHKCGDLCSLLNLPRPAATQTANK